MTSFEVTPSKAVFRAFYPRQASLLSITDFRIYLWFLECDSTFLAQNQEKKRSQALWPSPCVAAVTLES